MSSSLGRIQSVFHQALAVAADGRLAFLQEACGDDTELLSEVQSLLAHYDHDTSAFQIVAGRALSDLLRNAETNPGLAPDVMLGRYQLERTLGEGGMGSVYLATDTHLARKVAVKVISRAFVQTGEARLRFLREAQAAASLAHPNIATVFDFGQTDGCPWLVMEYIEGRPLLSDPRRPCGERQTFDDTERASTWGESRWTGYARQMADALAHAHSRGLIHRDIKPANILVTSSDQIKIIDFGLARAILGHAGADNSITAPGSFIGTIAYSAPEVLRGASASPRSDVYSLGVVLYEMACHQQPFSGLAGHDLISAVLMGNYPACRDRDPGIPPLIAEIIETCMSREPAARFSDASALLAALQKPAGLTSGFQAKSNRLAIAVFDFRQIGGAGNYEWLGTGIAETLTADLSKIKSIQVVGRGRVTQLSDRLGTDEDPSGTAIRLGRELGAGWIVTGSYQQLGERIRLTPALSDVATATLLMTDKIDGLLTNLFELQDRVVTTILDALTIQVDASEQAKILHPETRHLAAYEQYTNGRRRVSQLQRGSLSTAIYHFQQAVALDPDYVLAYAGLGTAHALRYIASSNADDIKCAAQYLERAIELDPELGEPYPWLANIRVRRNDPAGAFFAGQKGVELQPDLPEAHYFYAGLHYMLPEFRPGSIRQMSSHLAEAIRLEPKFHAAWVVLGATASFLGHYQDAIRILKEAVRLEEKPDLLFRFVGARSLLAFTQTRCGLWNEAQAQHLASIDLLRSIDHVYADTFIALSACGLGDIDLLIGDLDGAILHYRHARRVSRQSRRLLGGARLSFRADIGLAGTYALAGHTSRALDLMANAESQMDSFLSQTVTTTFECSVPQLWLLLAETAVRIGHLEKAGNYLNRARSSGWMDLHFLQGDPALRPLHDSPAFLDFVEELSAQPFVPLVAPAFENLVRAPDLIPSPERHS